MFTTNPNRDRQALAKVQPGVAGPPPAEYFVKSVPPTSQFSEYWSAIRSNLPLIAGGAILGALLGFGIGAFQPSMFAAKTVLDIRSLNENFLNSGEGSPTGASQSVLPESYIQTEIKILSSQSIRKRALGTIPGLKDAQAAPPKPSFPASLMGPAPLPYTSLVADAGRRIKVKALGNTRVVEISCEAMDGQVAAIVCNALAQTYIGNNLESRRESATDTSQWLQSQLDDAQRRLTQEENLLKEAGTSSEYGADGPVQSKLRQLQAELVRSQTERWVRESNLSAASSSDVNALPVEMDSGTVRQYRCNWAT